MQVVATQGNYLLVLMDLIDLIEAEEYMFIKSLPIDLEKWQTMTKDDKSTKGRKLMQLAQKFLYLTPKEGKQLLNEELNVKELVVLQENKLRKKYNNEVETLQGKVLYTLLNYVSAELLSQAAREGT